MIGVVGSMADDVYGNSDFHQQIGKRKHSDRERYQAPAGVDDEDDEADYENFEDSIEMEEKKTNQTEAFKEEVKAQAATNHNVCGTKSIVFLYVLLIASSVMWAALLSLLFVKYSQMRANFENCVSNGTAEIQTLKTHLTEKGSAEIKNLQTLLQEKDSQLSSNVRNLEKDISSMKTKDSQLSTSVRNLETEISSLKNKDSQLSTSVRNLETEISSLKNKDSQLSTSVRNLETEISSLKNKVCDIRTCPCDWKEFSGKCYYFSKGERDWQKAKDFCYNQDAVLAMVKTQQELDYIRGKITSNHWLGLSDLDTEDAWKWLDGDSVNLQSGFWDTNEPNNSGNEDCVICNREKTSQTFILEVTNFLEAGALKISFKLLFVHFELAGNRKFIRAVLQ
ncbi:low affinity immunoglobulin epsilon Fc receptor-like isoform X4 [Acipenser ruthenus]|uniref:low affinity immunoglobulin epsilon Fc receptor-like isoform X4 n=1 Tax=Acipenser ruthenus TaxID=7906 RepID=UPI002741F854|nr:low affinity immunoglobulin epsilon Fc receptor-like isoform X4 [Acipenser ruthenus]